ncbi:MAG: MBL fold metallo-hydrolase [Desulfobacteraceae bacterium]|nr:MBL fold metallo-hydrolase [Desulfobacteraceae bacterium]
MLIDKPGKVTDRIIFLGRNESSVYLLKGEGEYALIGGGMVHIVPDIMEQLKEYNIEEEKIKRIIILHAHFDHCAIVPFFKKRWPWATITASSRAKELLSFPKVIESIEFMNQVILEKYGYQEKAKELGLEFTGTDVEEEVKGGDILSCGDLSIEIIDTPGHSSCSIAAYVSQEKALFASDAGGIPFGDQVFTAANSNFDKYQDSLEKMAKYDTEIYLAEHYGAKTGEHGCHYLQKSITAAKETRELLEESLLRTKDVKKSAQEVTDKFMERAPENFLPRDIIAIVSEQMLKYLSKKLEI